MQVDIKKEKQILDEFFTVQKATLRFEKFDGSMSDEVERYAVRKSKAIAVLIYHVSKDAYILVRQFRYPLHDHAVDAWLTEIVAGGMNDNESPEDAAAREVMEETGYSVLRFQRITSCYVSPGIMDEFVHIFLAEVDDASRENEGGGAKGEDEDIELIWIPRANALSWMEDQKRGDAKTIIALQWHSLQF